MKFISKIIKRDTYIIRLVLNTETRKIDVLVIASDYSKYKISDTISYSNFENENAITSLLTNLDGLKVTDIESSFLYMDLLEKIDSKISMDKTLEVEADPELTDLINGIYSADKGLKFNTNKKTLDVLVAENFLRDYYLDKINEIVSKSNAKKRYYNLVVDYNLFYGEYKELTTFLDEKPVNTINSFNEAINNVRMDNKKDEVIIKVAIKNTDNYVKIKEKSSSLIGKFITTKGRIKQIYSNKAGIKTAKFECAGCTKTHWINQELESDSLIKPTICYNCGSKVFNIKKDESKYTDFQVIVIQEDYSEISDINNEEIEVYLYDTVLETGNDEFKVGSKVEIAGVLSTTSKDKQGLLKDYFIKGNYLKNLDNETNVEISETDEAKIKEIAKNDNCLSILISSFAKGIIADKELKLAILCALVSKSDKPNEEFRKKINILLIGDIATAKSQIIKNAEKVSPKYKSVSGMGSSSVGLTASVEQDKNNKWILQAGAYPLAGNGTLFIEEFDKLKKNKQSDLDTALSDSYISINKAGISTTIPALANVIAVANPKDKRFNDYDPLIEQININDDVLSRFDLIFKLQDKSDESKDYEIADKMLDRSLGKPLSKIKEKTDNLIDNDFLKKYLVYVKDVSDLDPKILDNSLKEEIKTEYSKVLRKLNGDSDTIPVTARNLEAIIRLSTSIAKLRLHKEVTKEDYKEALNLMGHTLKNFNYDYENEEFNVDRVVGSGNEKIEKEKRILLRIIIEESKKHLNKSIPKKDVITLFTEETKKSEREAYGIIKELEKHRKIKAKRGYIELIEKQIL